MRHAWMILLASALLAPCGLAMAQSDTATAKGLSIATAIVIQQSDDAAAIKAEDVWLVRHYPGCTKVRQALLDQHGRFYDAIDIVTKADESKRIYFDITKSQNALMDMFKH